MVVVDHLQVKYNQIFSVIIADLSAGFDSGDPFLFPWLLWRSCSFNLSNGSFSIKALSSSLSSLQLWNILVLYGFLLNYLLFSFYILIFGKKGNSSISTALLTTLSSRSCIQTAYTSMTLRDLKCIICISNVSLMIFNPQLSSYPDSLFVWILTQNMGIREFHPPSFANLEEAMAPYSSTLAWKIPWTEKPGRLQSMGSPRVGYDWVTSLSLFTFMHWKRKWQPTPVFLPGESQGQGSPVGFRLWGHTESDTTQVT